MICIRKKLFYNYLTFPQVFNPPIKNFIYGPKPIISKKNQK